MIAEFLENFFSSVPCSIPLINLSSFMVYFFKSVIVGSLIKNLGGGIAPNGAYIAGKKELINFIIH